MTVHTPLGEHAVVIGGSVAGILAARVLCDHFARVTLVERDELPTQPTFRAGAPHARHAHGLLVRGQQILEQFFPGLAAELYDQGALAVNMGREFSVTIGGTPVAPFQTDLSATLCSRPLLEHTLRRHILGSAQVRLLAHHRVLGLLTDRQQGRATGVRLQPCGEQDAAVQELPADLVVDASGRGSRLPQWLAEHGCQPPEETTIDAQTGYATRLYQLPAQPRSWQVLYAMPLAPAHTRGAILMPLEGERWMLSLTGQRGDHPPTDSAGFQAFAASVPSPTLAAALASAEPLGEPYGYRGAANRTRHYERLPRLLEGVVALCDAVCALNPVYGQGMTVAALGVLALDASLRQQQRRPNGHPVAGLARGFHRRLARVNAGPWQLATAQDLRWQLSAGGQRGASLNRLVQGYFDRVLLAMTTNGAVAARFTEVQNMVRSPAVLFHPRIVWQVLAAAPPARQRRG
jgi:flavin-dependent dehydrogenase